MVRTRLLAINLAIALVLSSGCSSGAPTAPSYSRAADEANASQTEDQYEADPNAQLKARQKNSEAQIVRLEAEIKSAEEKADEDFRTTRNQFDIKEAEFSDLALQVRNKNSEIRKKNSAIDELNATHATLQTTNRNLSRQLQDLRATLQQCQAMPAAE